MTAHVKYSQEDKMRSSHEVVMLNTWYDRLKVIYNWACGNEATIVATTVLKEMI
jgi:hypothetical protein